MDVGTPFLLAQYMFLESNYIHEYVKRQEQERKPLRVWLIIRKTES